LYSECSVFEPEQTSRLCADDIGVPTSERSLAAYLYITEQGDIEFSAEQHEVFSELNASYVLTGNIQKLNSGLMLKTKIIEIPNVRWGFVRAFSFGRGSNMPFLLAFCDVNVEYPFESLRPTSDRCERKRL